MPQDANDEAEKALVTRRAFVPVFRWHPQSGAVFHGSPPMFFYDPPGKHARDQIQSDRAQQKLAWLKKDPFSKKGF